MQWRKFAGWGILAVMLLVVVMGCSSSQTNGAAATPPAENAPAAEAGVPYPLTLTDALGRQLTISQEPHRIASLSPANTEILFALGLGEKIVGVTTWCDYPEEAKSKPKIGDLKGNLEKILEAQPDLVVGSGSLNRETIDRLTELGIPVLALEPQSIEDIYSSIRLVARATNTVAKGEEIIQGMQGKIASVQEKLAQVPPEQRVRVFIEVDYPLYTAGPGSFVHDLVTAAGGINVVSDVKFYAQYSDEQVIQLNPDVILATDYYYLADDQKIEHRPGWNKIKAVQEGRLITDVELYNLTNRPGPRAAEAVEILAREFYPDIGG